MKSGKLMKTLESDESWQPDEKLAKWWSLGSWWNFRKVMKVDNLMKSFENDEKSVFSYGLYFPLFCPDEFSPKVVLWFWGDKFLHAKAKQRRKRKWFEKVFDASNRNGRKNLNQTNIQAPQYQQRLLRRTNILFTLEYYWFEQKSK